MIDKSNEEWVKEALDYLSAFKEEMTSDKKHYTEVLIDEVWRLRKRLNLAERYIIEPTLIRNYFADVVSKGLDDERDNLG
tara:strand:- start:956 stop:1195 length:240 start_codon:yes stop_codon:yes gene_type:complete